MLTLVQGDGTATAPPVKRAADWWIETVESPSQAEMWLSAWEDLAWHAIEPNPFYEAWMFLRAWESFGIQDQVCLALIVRSGARAQDPAELCGVVPLWRKRHEQLPLDHWTLWRNDFICNCTPLLRQGVAVDAWRTFCEWLSTQSLPLLELPLVNADGPFQHALVEVANQRRTPIQTAYQYSRALLSPAESADTYCAQTMSCHNRQELRRQRRRLSEQGSLETRIHQPGDDIDPWIAEFLRLESSGWKGETGTAFAEDEVTANYLREIIRAGARTNQIAMLGLFLDNRAIALKLNFLSGRGGFTFKIAFDEAFKKYSPGVQLELENIAWFHDQRGLDWLDSCARPDHFMIGRLWKDRRLMQQLVMSTGSRWGDFLVGSLSFAKAIKSSLRARVKTSN